MRQYRPDPGLSLLLLLLYHHHLRRRRRPHCYSIFVAVVVVAVPPVPPMLSSAHTEKLSFTYLMYQYKNVDSSQNYRTYQKKYLKRKISSQNIGNNVYSFLSWRMVSYTFCKCHVRVCRMWAYSTAVFCSQSVRRFNVAHYYNDFSQMTREFQFQFLCLKHSTTGSQNGITSETVARMITYDI
jgi:hypothetical protein